VLHEQKAEGNTNDLEGKEKKEAVKEFKKAMHAEMDKAFALKAPFFKEHVKNRDTNKFWKLWSRTAEEAWITALGVEKELAKAMKGRGQVKIITKKPEQFRMKSQGGGANNTMMMATEKLRQARRCEQITTRLRGLANVGDDRKAKYIKYNNECIANVVKNLNDKESDEYELKTKIEANEGEAGGRVMMLPTLIKATKDFHEKHDNLKRKSKEESEKTRQQIFSIKGKGQWNLNKSMNDTESTPMIAARRRRGPRGQQKETITPDLKEVDAICREVYGEIYKGNTRDPEHTASRHMEMYDKYIYKAKRATMEALTGRDLRITLNDTKETASGLDQWKPAELKMLSDGALEQLATLLNLIEEGADWPT
jgi:hypothetical protein